MYEVTDEVPSLPGRDLAGREDNQIHVWCAVLSEFAPQLPLLHTQLSPDEKAQAERFRFPGDRNRFIARRGILRSVLSAYVDRPPSEIEFCYGQFGKPGIKGGLADERLNFSASHSGDLAVYAVARSCALGVDVERVRPIPHFEQIAGRFFSPRESAMLTTLPTEHRTEGFFACWTRKEAFLKATGEGIGDALAKVEVTVNPWEEPEILSTTAETELPLTWQLRSFSPAPGYLAAIAFQHHDLTLRKWWVHVPLGLRA